MATRKKPSPDKPETADPVLTRKIKIADKEYKRLLAIDSDHYEHLRAVHLAGQLVWNLRADECYAAGKHDAARKASMTAESHGKLAAKLARDSIVDRVAALEAEVRKRRDFAGSLEGLE
jgi:hypothetical protein